MNDNQKVFEAITGFRASYKSGGAGQEYDEQSKKAILEVVDGTVDNADFYDLDIDSSAVDIEKVATAIFDFHACDSGLGNDLDIIFDSLKDKQ